MSNNSIPLDVAAAEDHLMRFLSVEGVTGQEANIAAAVCDALKKVGVPESAIRFDVVLQHVQTLASARSRSIDRSTQIG